MNWTAKWIWRDQGSQPRNQWWFFRKEFAAPEALWDGAQLRITADSQYEVYVNGQRLGQGPSRSWPFAYSFDEYDVTDLIYHDQLNVIAVQVLHFGVATFSYPYESDRRAGLLAEIVFDDKENEIGRVGTDGTWKTARNSAQNSRAPRMSCQLPFAEQIDARRGHHQWMMRTCPDAGWSNACEVGSVGDSPWNELVRRDIPHLTEEKVSPRRVDSLAEVVPVTFSTTLDVRAQLVPESKHHANPIYYTGYIATTVRVLEPTDLVIGFHASGSVMTGVMVDGMRHDVNAMTGELPERYLPLRLDAGDHLLLLDMNGTDHGRPVQLAMDSTQTIQLVSPIQDADTPFVSLGPFASAQRVDFREHPHVDLDHPIYRAIGQCRTSGDLQFFLPYTRPFSRDLIAEDNVFSKCIWKRHRVEHPVPSELQYLVIPNASAAILPHYDEADTEIIIDFGRELSGYLQFDLDAGEGTIVDLYGYEYQLDGWRQNTFDLDNTLRYTCREGRQTYRSLIRRGFRYLMMTVRNAQRPVRVFHVEMIQSNFPIAEVGQFSCSDELLNRIWQMAQHTTRLCMEDTFVDCPAYEQVFWVGDSRNESLVNYALFGADDLVRHSLMLVPHSQKQTPLLNDQVPSGWDSVIPNWSFLWILACVEYDERTGDDSFFEWMLPHISMVLDEFWSYIDERGLLSIRAWNLLDWAPMEQPNDGVVAHQNLLLVRTLHEVARTLETVDEKASQVFAQRARNLAAAINQHLWSENQQAYLDCIYMDGRLSTTFSLQTQVMAYISNVPTPERRRRIEQMLLDPPDHFVQIASPFMAFFYYEALHSACSPERIIEDIRTHYGEMLRYGATTCWEMYPNFKENKSNEKFLTRSHCHAWSAAPAYFLPLEILGIQSTSVGMRSVAVHPQPCGLTWARGSVPLPAKGRVDVSWTCANQHLSIHIVAPTDVQIDVKIPEGYTGETDIQRISL